MLESGEGTTSGAADQARPVVTWEIAPLRAAALRTERAVNQRWETLRAAIIGGAVLLGVIGSAAALSLTGISSVPGGMGFLSAGSSSPSAAEHEVTAGEARDGVADEGAPAKPADPAPPAEEDEASNASPPSGVAPAATQPEPERATPSAAPQPEPEPTIAPVPEPSPTPSTPAADAAEDDGGLIEDLLDLLLPGLLP